MVSLKAAPLSLPPKERLQRILNLAMPVIAGMVSQNVLNLVDTAMVSRLPNSNAALAAVGYGGFALFLAQSIILGLSTGVQASAARRKGQGRLAETGHFLNAALVIILLVAPVLTLALHHVIPFLYPYINHDPEVIALGVPYLQIRSAGIIFVAMNFSFRGYWNAVDLTRLYMTTLISMHLLNIVLNYILIFGHFGAPALGVQGAAYASVISLAFGTTIYFWLGARWARAYGFLQKLPGREDIKRLVQLSLPNGVQQMFFSAGFLALFWIIGQVGTAEVAAANVLMNLMLVAYLPGMGFGLAAATLVGQALGRNDAADASRWAWDVVTVALIVMVLIGLPMVLAPETVLTSIYRLSPETLEVALWPLRLVGLSMVFEAVGTILQNALLGAGDARRVMLTSIANQWLLFLPAAYIVGPLLGFGLTALWSLQVVSRCIQAMIFAAYWRGQRWAHIKI
jgi:putative MATE family efflux protein